jgi:hypothetical protein
MREEQTLAEIEDFIEGFNQPTYRDMRVDGVRVATWSSEHGWSGNCRPEADRSTSLLGSSYRRRAERGPRRSEQRRLISGHRLIAWL